MGMDAKDAALGRARGEGATAGDKKRKLGAAAKERRKPSGAGKSK